MKCSFCDSEAVATINDAPHHGVCMADWLCLPYDYPRMLAYARYLDRCAAEGTTPVEYREFSLQVI